MSRKSPLEKGSTPPTLARPPKGMAICRELVPGLVGLCLALALLKFGNPVILDSRIETPHSFIALIHQPWPVSWGYALLGLILILGLPLWQWSVGVPRWLAGLPAIWFIWQLISATESVDRTLTTATLPHFFACITSFYLGLFALSRVGKSDLLWVGVIGGWLIVVLVGWRQQFGGLQEVREFFFSLPDWQSQPAELIAKINSDRIYSTLVYPNALAGVLLVFTPPILAVVYRALHRQRMWWRWGAVATLFSAAVCCLIWSGSKGGWLIGLASVSIAILKSVNSMRLRIVLACLLIGLGMAGFWTRHARYFHQGATSLTARGDYWKAAATAFAERPILGSGPGTFMTVYRRLKSPDAEMTRLVHNDYLQQASDSGLLGFLTYIVFCGGALVFLYRRCAPGTLEFWIWLGLAGGAVQSAIEFSLYIPALAWPCFLGLGVLLGRAGLSKSVDNPLRPHYGSPPRL